MAEKFGPRPHLGEAPSPEEYVNDAWGQGAYYVGYVGYHLDGHGGHNGLDLYTLPTQLVFHMSQVYSWAMLPDVREPDQWWRARACQYVGTRTFL